MSPDDAPDTSHGDARRSAVGVGLALLSAIAYAAVNALLRAVAGEVDPYVGSFVRQLPLLTVLLLGAIVLRPRALRPGVEPWLGTLGFACAVVTGCCYGVSNWASRVGQRRPGRFIATLGVLSLSAVVALAVVILVRTGIDAELGLMTLNGHKWATLLVAGGANAVAVGSVTLAVRFTTITTAVMLNALVVVFGVAFGAWFFDEPVTLLLGVGSALILGGVVFVHVRVRRRH